MENGFIIVAACGHCWYQLQQRLQSDGQWSRLSVSFDVFLYIQLLVNCCFVILFLTYFDDGVMVGEVVLQSGNCFVWAVCHVRM